MNDWSGSVILRSHICDMNSNHYAEADASHLGGCEINECNYLWRRGRRRRLYPLVIVEWEDLEPNKYEQQSMCVTNMIQ